MNEPRIIPGSAVLPPMAGPMPRPLANPGAPGKGKPGQRTTGDRFTVLNAFADYGARLVNPTAQACWWIIYRETKPDGLARASHGRIAGCIGVSRHTALRAMRRLERAGLLTVVKRGGLRGGASVYRVHGIPKRCSADATPPRSTAATCPIRDHKRVTRLMG